MNEERAKEIEAFLRGRGGRASNGELRDEFGGYFAMRLRALERRGRVRRIESNEPPPLTVVGPAWDAWWRSLEWEVA